ncbi:MAG: YggS family pyridoxal phosphate-dependent enzyme [Spirochaetaceae bacterium]|nr:MAG: YggS family pyridoxal phosphate-dependent enzyme [Spirochaetaceae bacterium]
MIFREPSSRGTLHPVEPKLTERLSEIQEKLAAAAGRSGRTKEDVRLIAVSKTHDVSAVREAYEAGVRDFGESRVQEAEEKFHGLTDLQDIRLHLIGRLQSNKAKKVPGLFACVHSVDRDSLLYELDKRVQELGSISENQLEILIQLNTSGEEQKQGVASYEAACELLSVAHRCMALRVTGFMTMAPYTNDTALIRRCFAATREIAERCRLQFPDMPLKVLSMGMSNDYEIAIEEGATMVRVGSALFGER